MLKEIITNKRYSFHDSFENWQDAIVAGCKPLEENGCIYETYSTEIIECVKKYGPYIVLMPLVALPHAQMNSSSVKKTAVGFMKVERAVQFDINNREKDANLFFTIAAENSELHMKNLMELSEILSNEKVVQALLSAKNKEDLMSISLKFSC